MGKKTPLQRHQELESQGWVRRFDGEEPRISEMKGVYESMGLQVLIEPGMIGNEDACVTCFTAAGFEDRYKTVYTREARAGTAERDDDLYE